MSEDYDWEIPPSARVLFYVAYATVACALLYMTLTITLAP